MDTQTALVVITAFLVLVTLFYASSTKKMAGAMIKELEIRVTPRVNLELSQSPVGGVRNDISFKLTNKGNFQVKLVREIIHYFLISNKDELLHTDENKETNCWISPKEEQKRRFYYDFRNKGKEIQSSTDREIRVAIKVVFEFENVMGDTHTEQFKRTIRLGEKDDLLKFCSDKSEKSHIK